MCQVAQLQFNILRMCACYSDLPNVEEGETTTIPLLLVDTAGCNLPELDLPQEVSKGNEGSHNYSRMCSELSWLIRPNVAIVSGKLLSRKIIHGLHCL